MGAAESARPQTLENEADLHDLVSVFLGGLTVHSRFGRAHSPLGKEGRLPDGQALVNVIRSPVTAHGEASAWDNFVFPKGHLLTARDSDEPTGEGTSKESHANEKDQVPSTAGEKDAAAQAQSKPPKEAVPKSLSAQHKDKNAVPILGGVGGAVKSTLWTGVGLLGTIIDNWSRKRK